MANELYMSSIAVQMINQFGSKVQRIDEGHCGGRQHPIEDQKGSTSSKCPVWATSVAIRGYRAFVLINELGRSVEDNEMGIKVRGSAN